MRVCVVKEWPVSSAVDRITNIKNSPNTDSRLTVPTSVRLRQDFRWDAPWRRWFISWDLVDLYHNFLDYIFHDITVCMRVYWLGFLSLFVCKSYIIQLISSSSLTNIGSCFDIFSFLLLWYKFSIFKAQFSHFPSLCFVIFVIYQYAFLF